MNKIMNKTVPKCRYLRILHIHGDLPAAGTASPAGGVPDGRPPTAMAKGWMASHGIYGHLPDPLHAWDHPATFLGCVQVRSMRSWGDYVFSEGSGSDRRKASRRSVNQLTAGRDRFAKARVVIPLLEHVQSPGPSEYSNGPIDAAGGWEQHSQTLFSQRPQPGNPFGHPLGTL